MGLLALPEEVLEIALKYLLPPFRSQSLGETYVFTVPIDLLAARLVCRRLQRIATPLAWRRAQLQFARPATATFGYYGEDSCDDITAAKRATNRSVMRCRFLQDNPHLAVHVRFLLLSLEWHSESPDATRKVLRAATDAMSNLRTVLVWDADVLAVKDIQQLLQKPLLRAVCLMDVDGSAFPAECNWGAGLKMLHVVNSVCPAKLISGAAASLECVSIELARSFPGTIQPVATLREMPWKTLREVALVDCVNEVDWFCFLDGFQLHRGSGLPTVLTELMIGDLAGLEPDRVSQLLEAFSGQPLTRLMIYHVVSLDPSTVGRVALAFPTLRHLTLLTEGELAPWSGTLDLYAQKFACFPHLETLVWNNFLLGLSDVTFLSLNEFKLGMLYARHAHVLRKRVRSLRRIKFMSATDGVVDTVYVRKNVGGLVEVRRSTEAALHTSSWSTASETFQDI